MPSGPLKRATVRRYDIDGRIYTARRVMSACGSPSLDWAVTNDQGVFLFLVHYWRDDKRYRLHGNMHQRAGIGGAIRDALRGH